MTNEQILFLEYYFSPEIRGDIRRAMEAAGIPNSTPIQSFIEPLEEEIENRTRKFLATRSVQAAFAIISVIEDPTYPGNKEKLAAAKDILDRAGFKSSDNINVIGDAQPVFVIPPKPKANEDDEDTGNQP